MLPVELDVVWSKKLQPLNVLYIVQRYMPFVDTVAILFTVSFANPIDPNTCRILYTTSGWMYIIGIALTEVVLTIRTWAFWRNDIRMTIGLVIFFLGCWAPNLYIMHLYLQSQAYSPSPLPEIGCVILGGKSILFLCWVILMVYEAGLPRIVRAGNRSPLTTVVYRDVLSVANLVIVLLLPNALQNLVGPHQRVIQTILTSRAILHMRRHQPKLEIFFVCSAAELQNFK
ncbi:hypothetical protein BDP27DRAFT_1404082 [Rhodocollybia butyracea]|uniref:Uncharacterized protein n=1 Tax=Rhodocollybia butyracea TaxID=206335 RepID=A0A9P5PRX4_9AGAR|nr:hypothetical protein BDP27DRAFT_1404082 [Rhodocollybia butyracea]